jgi:hypothetical protein
VMPVRLAEQRQRRAITMVLLRCGALWGIASDECL